MVKNLPANVEDTGLIPGSKGSPGGGNGNPLQYSCLENSMDRGDWQATVHRVAKSQTRQLPNMSMTIGMRKWCRNGADSGKVDHYIPENSAE